MLGNHGANIAIVRGAAAFVQRPEDHSKATSERVLLAWACMSLGRADKRAGRGR